MFVVPRGGRAERERVHHALASLYMPRSRFTFAFDTDRVSCRRSGRPYEDSFALRLVTIRLRRRKYYCGQHAGPCLLETARKHPLCRYLEGADWVAFDDMVNDCLDRLKVEAEVWSGGREFAREYFIRHGRRRRTSYPAKVVSRTVYHYAGPPTTVSFTRWDCDDASGGFDDAHFGVCADAARSSFAEGTPGVPEWRTSKGRRLEDMLLRIERAGGHR